MSKSRRSSPARRSMFEAIKQACYSAHGTARLSLEITTRLETGIRTSGVAVATTDPELGILTAIYPGGMPPELVERYAAVVYPVADAVALIDQARTGQTVSVSRSPLFDEELGGQLGARMHVVAVDSGMLWGWLCLVRGPQEEAFDADEMRLMARLGPHVGAGLRRAALLDAARQAETDDSPASPVVLVVSDRGQVSMRGAGSARVAEDLAGPGWDPSRPPPAVAGALARLYEAERQSQPDDDGALEGIVRVQGRSGRWYEISASRAESRRTDGTSVVVIAPVRAEGRLNVLSRLYGLTPREREVVQRVAHGKSTKAIARELRLSPYTIQEHIGKASEKVGVRGRRELVARLFLDSGLRATS